MNLISFIMYHSPIGTHVNVDSILYQLLLGVGNFIALPARLQASSVVNPGTLTALIEAPPEELLVVNIAVITIIVQIIHRLQLSLRLPPTISTAS